MHYTAMIDIASKVGIPAAILFWILFINGQNQRDMIKQMHSIEKAITNLTYGVHDMITYIKARGGA